MKHQYIIKVKKEETFLSTIQKLLDVGFVFSDYRYKNVDDIKRRWGSCGIWNCIKVGYNDRCRIVLHSPGMCGNDVYTISVDEFLKIDYK